MRRLVTGAIILLWISVLCSQAQATHIQYVEYADLDDPDITVGDTWEWTFDLLNDDMFLWEIDTHHDSSHTTPDISDPNYIGTGSYDLASALHYVTLRIDPNNLRGPSYPTSDEVTLTVNGVELDSWSNPIRLYDWGVPGGTIDDPYGIAANDYTITVLLSGLNSLPSNKPIENVNIEGCFDTAPIPEPATMLLFGTGLAGLVGSRIRKKKK